MEAVVNAAAEFPGQVGAGFAWPFVDGEVFRGERRWVGDAAQTQQRSAVGFEAGVVLPAEGSRHLELSGHEGLLSRGWCQAEVSPKSRAYRAVRD